MKKILLLFVPLFASCATSQSIKVNQDDGEKKQVLEIETKGQVNSLSLLFNFTNLKSYETKEKSFASCSQASR